MHDARDSVKVEVSRGGVYENSKNGTVCEGA